MKAKDISIRLGAICKFAECFGNHMTASLIASQLNSEVTYRFSKAMLREILDESIKISQQNSKETMRNRKCSMADEEAVAKYEHELLQELNRLFEATFTE